MLHTPHPSTQDYPGFNLRRIHYKLIRDRGLDVGHWQAFYDHFLATLDGLPEVPAASRAAALASPAAAAARRLQQRKSSCSADCCSSLRPDKLQAARQRQTKRQWLPGSAAAAAAQAAVQNPTRPQPVQGVTADTASASAARRQGQVGWRR